MSNDATLAEHGGPYNRCFLSGTSRSVGPHARTLASPAAHADSWLLLRTDGVGHRARTGGREDEAIATARVALERGSPAGDETARLPVSCTGRHISRAAN